MDLYSQTLPPAPHNYLHDGLRNLRHGTMNEHPLETHIRQLTSSKNNEEFKETAALFGIGFAKQMKHQRKQMEMAIPSFESELGYELQTGEIDDLDFEDMFDGNNSVAEVQCDPHEIQEIRFFK